MLCVACETRQSGPGNMTANSILVETHGFLIAAIPGIRPVLLQKKQVDQANAINGRLLPTDGRGPPSPASSA
jgi:hypothetical protein